MPKKKLLWTTFRGNNTFPIYNWYYFTEAYSRALVMMYLKKYAKRSFKLLDPFCGTGTSLLAAKEFSLDAVGYDISPLMYIVSKAKTYDYDLELLDKEFSSLNFEIKDHLEVPKWIRKYFYASNLKQLIAIKEAIKNKKYDFFFKLLLLKTISIVTKAEKSGKSLRFRKRPELDAIKIFHKQYKRFVKDLKKFYKKNSNLGKVKVFNKAFNEAEGKYDIIITSPPYLNKTEYTRRFGIELYFLDENTEIKGMGHKDIDYDLKESFYDKYFKDIIDKIRSSKEHKMPNYSVDSYFKGLELLFEKSYSLLKDRGYFIIVIAGGCFKNYAIDIYDYLKKLAYLKGFSLVEEKINRELICHKNRIQKIGKVKEFTFVLKKD